MKTLDLIAEEAKTLGISEQGIYACWKLGVAAYLAVIRLGGFFPNHS